MNRIRCNICEEEMAGPVLRRKGSMMGGSLKSRLKKLARFAIKQGLPVLKDIGRSLGVSILPAIGSMGQDYLAKKGAPSIVGDLLASASVMGAKKLGEQNRSVSDKPRQAVSDYISQKAQDAIARKLAGRGPRGIAGVGPRNVGAGPRNIGGSPRNVGGSPRNIGGQGPRNVGAGPRNIGGSLLGQGAFSSLDVGRREL